MDKSIIMDYKVLIVDDDPMMLFLHKNLIVKSGISLTPETFLNGQEALEFLMAEPAGQSCYTILLDLNMPVMNGWQLLEELLEKPIAAAIDVVIVSSSVARKDKEKALEYKMVASYLPKPFYNLEEVRRLKHRRMVLE